MLINHPIYDQDIENLPETAKALTEFELCFVNNLSKSDSVFFDSLEFSYEHLRFVHIKKKMNNQKAIKAGVRLLYSIPQVKFISYYIIKPNETSIKSLLHFIYIHKSHICKLVKVYQTSYIKTKNIPEIAIL